MNGGEKYRELAEIRRLTRCYLEEELRDRATISAFQESIWGAPDKGGSNQGLRRP